MRLALQSLAVALSMLGGTAMAEDLIPAEVPQCLGAYGALADQAQAMSAWSPALGRSNLTKIDWAARRARLLRTADGEPEEGEEGFFESVSSPYLNGYKMRLAADRINGTAADTSAILELSIRCDQANHFSPSFAIPAS
ncbi:MAG: hypothetical protein Q8L23_13185 [Caulobacter sp.]|nr:hypothetical protein [Caulobacter sp.]